MTALFAAFFLLAGAAAAAVWIVTLDSLRFVARLAAAAALAFFALATMAAYKAAAQPRTPEPANCQPVYALKADAEVVRILQDSEGDWWATVRFTSTGRIGVKCCSDLDRECRPVRSDYDFTRGIYVILVDGRWRDVPPEAVLTRVESPDGRSYACIGKSGSIFCFVNGKVRS